MSSPSTSPVQSADQAGPEVSETMAPAATELLRDLMDRHRLDSKSLAAEADLSPGYFSRVLSGQYPVTLSLARVLWKRTGDAAVLDYIIGDEQSIVLFETRTIDVRTADRAHLCSAAISSCANAAINATLAFFGPKSSSVDLPGQAIGIISSALKDLLRLREALRSQAAPPKAGTNGCCGVPSEHASASPRPAGWHRVVAAQTAANLAERTAPLVDARA